MTLRSCFAEVGQLSLYVSGLMHFVGTDGKANDDKVYNPDQVDVASWPASKVSIVLLIIAEYLITTGFKSCQRITPKDAGSQWSAGRSTRFAAVFCWRHSSR